MDGGPGRADDGLLAELTRLADLAGNLRAECWHPHTADLLARVVDVLADARTGLALERSLERLRLGLR
jgi:hypothetical protein